MSGRRRLSFESTLDKDVNFFIKHKEKYELFLKQNFSKKFICIHKGNYLSISCLISCRVFVL